MKVKQTDDLIKEILLTDNNIGSENNTSNKINLNSEVVVNNSTNNDIIGLNLLNNNIDLNPSTNNNVKIDNNISEINSNVQNALNNLVLRSQCQTLRYEQL